MIVLIDNYDSFTYNIFQYLAQLGADVVVHRNDRITVEEVLAADPDGIVLSPGPCTPKEAGICCDLITAAAGHVPLLGVCLGHQCIGHVFGGDIVRAPRLMHGKTSHILHDGRGLFQGIPSPFTAVRYHSLVIQPDTMPDCLEMSAKTDMDEIMGVRHREYRIEGVQFHPESILTQFGMELLANFLADDRHRGPAGTVHTVCRRRSVMLRDTLTRLIDGDTITCDEAENAMRQIMSGAASEAEIGGFLVAMRIRGEAPEHIEGFARVMRDACVPISARSDDLVDTCGTGGDRLQTFNISTAAAFVAAGAGVKIAKHGNRSVSSKCGSADVLAEMGVNIDATPQQVADSIDDAGLGFLFAPNLHPAMRHAIGPRRALGLRTVFNVLGPLTNPAGASRQLLGVYSADLTQTLAETLRRLGSVHALVVHGLDGIDELSTVGPTQVSELRDGAVQTYIVTPEQFGIRRCRPEEISGGEAADNAQTIIALLDGEPGPVRDITVLNAAATIYVGAKADTIDAAMQMACDSIDTGSALRVLQRLRMQPVPTEGRG